MARASTASHRDLLGGMAYPLLERPAGRRVDRARSRGTPSARRARCSCSASAPPSRPQRVALRNIPPGRTFDLIEAPTGALHAHGDLRAAHRRASTSRCPSPTPRRCCSSCPVEGTAAAARRPRREPPPAEWLAGDLHVHTCYSHDAYCGPDDDNTGPEEAYTLSGSVDERFREASLRGLDYLAITDHNDTRSADRPRLRRRTA